jgi:hypothetical protein
VTAVGSGPKYWARWALRMAELHGLGDGEARMLSALAAHARTTVKGGEVTAGEKLLAREAGRKPRSARRLMARLKQRGLLTVEMRGRGEALRVLHDVLPVEQPSLDGFDSALSGRVRPAISTGQPANRPTGQPANSLCTSTGQSSVPQKGVEEVKEEGEARDYAPPDLGVVEPTLAEVLAVLERARTASLLVEPMAINAALAAHPESDGYEHRKAALRVVEWTHQGGLRVSAANQLLWDVFLKQDQRRRRTGTGTSRSGHGTRGRFERAERPAAKVKPWSGALARAFAEQQGAEQEAAAR